MIGYLLDTNVISEIMRSAPHPGVVAFLSEREDLWLSSIVIHELEYGVRRMPQGRRRGRLEAELSRLFRSMSTASCPLSETVRSGRPSFVCRPRAPAGRWSWVTP